MRVGLVDVDRTSWRNLHLMRRATYHKAQGDTVLFPYDGAEPVDLLIMSSVFTRNRPLVFRWLKHLGITPTEQDPLFASMELPDWIQIGGTGWNIHAKAPAEVEVCSPAYALYDGLHGPANYGQGFTSRGCPRGCHFCVVPEMSGNVVKPINTLADLRNGEHKFVKLMDDNFWAPGNEWRERMLEAIDGKLELSFTQGLDMRYVDEERAELLARVSFWDESHHNRIVTFAFDRPNIERIYRRGFELLMKAGLRPGQIASFVLTGFDTTVEEDMRRVEVLRELGALPFVMVYEPINGEDIPDFYKRGGALP